MDQETVSQSLGRYCAIMNEITKRLDIVQKAASGELVGHGQLTAEICFLQYRKICELIGLGCLSAHGDLGRSVHSSILKEWDVQKVMRALERLGEDFYPDPVLINVVDSEVRIEKSLLVPVLDKENLLKLYWKSGEYLHRGSLKKLFAGETIDVSLEIVDWSKKIVYLLNQHRIFLFGYGESIQLFCSMRGSSGLSESFISGSKSLAV